AVTVAGKARGTTPVEVELDDSLAARPSVSIGLHKAGFEEATVEVDLRDGVIEEAERLVVVAERTLSPAARRPIQRPAYRPPPSAPPAEVPRDQPTPADEATPAPPRPPVDRDQPILEEDPLTAPGTPGKPPATPRPSSPAPRDLAPPEPAPGPPADEPSAPPPTGEPTPDWAD